jgi:glycosyltransferase 2 family protein
LKKYWKVWVGILISVLATWFALKDIKFNEVVNTFGQLNWWMLALSYIPYFIPLVVKITRWQLLFSPEPKIRLQRLWATLMMSYFFNTVLPMRLGEVVRAYALSRSEKIGTVRVLSTILLEKIMDVMCMFIFLVGLLPFLSLSEDFKTPALVVGGLVVAAFLVCMLMAAYRKQAERLISWFLKPLPPHFHDKLLGFVEEILDVLVLLLNFKLSLNLWAQTIFLWSLVVFNYMMVGWSLNLPLTFEIALVLMIALNLGMAIPSAPGYVGVFEGLVVFAMTPFFPGQESQVLSLALMLHVGGFLPVIILGAFHTSREGVAMSKLTKAEPEPGELAPATSSTK